MIGGNSDGYLMIVLETSVVNTGTAHPARASIVEIDASGHPRCV
jgi:hypothetical protein